jgi:hypothetical protein
VAPEVNPGWGVELSGTRTRVYQPNGTVNLTLAEAADLGYVEPSLISYDGGYEVVAEGCADASALEAWKAYWMKVNQPGLTLQVPGPMVDPGSGGCASYSGVKLSLDADGCVTSNFSPRMSVSGSDSIMAGEDVLFPPVGPSAQKEVRLGTSAGLDLVLVDMKQDPGVGNTKTWTCTAEAVHFAGAECKMVTVTWDLSEAGDWDYKLVDVGNSTDTVMQEAGSYQFEICQGEVLSFQIVAGDFAPAANVTKWASVRDHDNTAGANLQEIELDPAAAGVDVMSESRRNSPLSPADQKSGVKMITVDFDADVTACYTPGVMAVDANDPANPLRQWLASDEYLTNGGTRLVLEFMADVPGDLDVSDSTLPDETCLLIDLSANISCLASDPDCMVRGLTGDVTGAPGGNGNGQTNMTDAAAIRAAFLSGAVVSGDDVRLDVVANGQINQTDAAYVRDINFSGGLGVLCP